VPAHDGGEPRSRWWDRNPIAFRLGCYLTIVAAAYTLVQANTVGLLVLALTVGLAAGHRAAAVVLLAVTGVGIVASAALLVPHFWAALPWLGVAMLVFVAIAFAVPPLDRQVRLPRDWGDWATSPGYHLLLLLAALTPTALALVNG
jgi:hypothetical protein